MQRVEGSILECPRYSRLLSWWIFCRESSPTLFERSGLFLCNFCLESFWGCSLIQHFLKEKKNVRATFRRPTNYIRSTVWVSFEILQRQGPNWLLLIRSGVVSFLTLNKETQTVRLWQYISMGNLIRNFRLICNIFSALPSYTKSCQTIMFYFAI